MKRSPKLALPLLVAGLGACAPDAEPVLPAAAPVTSASAAAVDLKQGFEVAVDDAGARVIPTLQELPGASAVAATFATLGEAVRSGNAPRVSGAAQAARQALAALENASPEVDAVEVAALRLVLDNADLLYSDAQ
jgi:hypothetical protein